MKGLLEKNQWFKDTIVIIMKVNNGFDIFINVFTVHISSGKGVFTDHDLLFVSDKPMKALYDGGSSVRCPVLLHLLSIHCNKYLQTISTSIPLPMRC